MLSHRNLKSRSSAASPGLQTSLNFYLNHNTNVGCACSLKLAVAAADLVVYLFDDQGISLVYRLRLEDRSAVQERDEINSRRNRWTLEQLLCILFVLWPSVLTPPNSPLLRVINASSSIGKCPS